MWKFDGRFLTFGSNATWPARSGGSKGDSSNVSYGADGRALALDNGPYRIVKRGEKHGPVPVKNPKMLIPGREEGWFVPLEPLFPTIRGTPERGRFGIHPDGGKRGTEGCIGVFGGDYGELYELLIDPATSDQLKVCIEDDFLWYRTDGR